MRAVYPVLCRALLLVLAGTPAFADDLVVSNATEGEIVSLFVSDLAGTVWGPDQLDEPLQPGATLTIRNLEPGLHRMRVIDEDDGECILDNVPVKGGNTFTLTDDALDECQAPDEQGKGAALSGPVRAMAQAGPAQGTTPKD
jgi:hypothetical protein